MKLHSATVAHALLIGLAVSQASATASAQASASVTIPFAFSADHQSVAAGSYKVQLLSDRYLSLRNTETNKTQVVMVRPESARGIETRGHLVFYRQGTRRYLTQAWFAGSSLHSEMAVQPKPQRELKTRQVTPSTIELAMK
jgi:hypothetical protein